MTKFTHSKTPFSKALKITVNLNQLQIRCSWDDASWYISIVKPTRCIIFRVYWILLYMLRTIFPSIIRSPSLYIYLMLYVQTWTPDDGWKDHLKHVEWYSINSKNCASSWFYYRNKTAGNNKQLLIFKILNFIPIVTSILGKLPLSVHSLSGTSAKFPKVCAS